MNPWRARRIRYAWRANNAIADRYMADIKGEFLKEEEIDENDLLLSSRGEEFVTEC